MFNLGIPFFITNPAASAGGGSDWYAPFSDALPPGTLPVASGTQALAAGDGALADGNQAVAIGDDARAAGTGSVAIGDNASALNTTGVAVGTNASSGVGSACTAIGSGSTTSGGNTSVAIGSSATVTAGEAVAIGSSVSATANNCVTIGVQSTSATGNATAIGPIATATGASSVALGQSTADTTGGVSLPGANTFNDWEIQSVNATGARRMACVSGGATTNAALTNVGTFVLPDNAACAFNGKCAAYRTAGGGVVGDSAAWMISGLISQVGGVYVLVGAAVGVAGAPNFNDAGAATWTLAIAIVANVVRVQATGQVGETIHFETALDFVTTN